MIVNVNRSAPVRAGFAEATAGAATGRAAASSAPTMWIRKGPPIRHDMSYEDGQTPLGFVAGFRPRNHSVRFPDRATFVAGSCQAFVGDFRPQLFQRSRCRLVRMPFGIIRSPRHSQAPVNG